MQTPGFPNPDAHHRGPPPGAGYAPPAGPPVPQHHGSFQQPPPPQQQQPAAGSTQLINTTGNFEGMQFAIQHRDNNTILCVTLHPGYQFKALPGSMVAMDPTVQIQGKLKFSVSKLFTDSEMAESHFTGPGEVILAPDIWGDIVPIYLDGRVPWKVGKHSYLACTQGIIKTHKSQGVMKGLFSGEGIFVHEVSGQGIIFVQSMGAIVQRQLREGEQWIVDNGHLVAWSASYKVERIQAQGGFLSKLHTDEGLVCRFTGPGTVYIQTRNPDNFVSWISSQLPSNSA